MEFPLQDIVFLVTTLMTTEFKAPVVSFRCGNVCHRHMLGDFSLIWNILVIFFSLFLPPFLVRTRFVSFLSQPMERIQQAPTWRAWRSSRWRWTDTGTSMWLTSRPWYSPSPSQTGVLWAGKGPMMGDAEVGWGCGACEIDGWYQLCLPLYVIKDDDSFSKWVCREWVQN